MIRVADALHLDNADWRDAPSSDMQQHTNCANIIQFVFDAGVPLVFTLLFTKRVYVGPVRYVPENLVQ